MNLILITGVNGYIGSRIAGSLLNKGYSIIGVDLNNNNCVHLMNNVKFKFIKKDIIELNNDDIRFFKINILIHCAAMIHSGIHGPSWNDYYKVNVEGTKKLISVLNVKSLKQIIFLSSVSVYGKLRHEEVPNEETIPLPEDFYGESKYIAEKEISIFGKKNKIPFTLFRLAPVYGEKRLLNINKRIYLPFKIAFYKISSGKQRLSLCSIDNVIQAVIYSINNKKFFYETFIIKDKEDYSINELIIIFKKIFLQKNKPVVRIPLFLLNSLITCIGLVFPGKRKFFKYQLDKIYKDSIYSAEKLKLTGIKLNSKLENTSIYEKVRIKSSIYFFLKRLTDLLISILVLLFVLPVFIVVIPILKLTGEGEVFFIQKRVGKRNINFNLLKFATMLKDSPKTGTVTVKNDSRILPVGHFLRNTKINELPQILNVIKGDMSLVGFRPLAEDVFQYYPNDIKKYILRMKPGVTGLGSIVFRNEEEILFNSKKKKMECYINDIIPLKGALEKWYAEHCNLWVDFKILLATALIIIFKKAKFYIKWFPIELILKKSTLKKYFIY